MVAQTRPKKTNNTNQHAKVNGKIFMRSQPKMKSCRQLVANKRVFSRDKLPNKLSNPNPLTLTHVYVSNIKWTEQIEFINLHSQN